jgi:hypothetical protein
MPKPSLFLAALAVSAAFAGSAAAQDLGKVTKVLRPQVQTFDDKGALVGMMPAKDIKTPTPIVAVGAGNRLAIKVKDRVLYVRGLDVQTEGLTAKCAPVQTAAREKGSSYAASNMGLGGAAVCK